MLQYLISAIVFVILDGTYLNLVKGYFNKQVKSIQGSDIQINIVATGLGQFNYVWYKNEQAIPFQVEDKLLIFSPTAIDVGTYQVKVNAYYGSVLSPTFDVNVI